MGVRGVQDFDEGATSGSAVAQELAWVAPTRPLKKLSSEPLVKSGVDLTKVEVVVAAGRGFAEKDDLSLAHEFCDRIGAGLGCTRPLSEGVDWFPTEAYIGVSGLMLAPKIYVGLGVSGLLRLRCGIGPELAHIPVAHSIRRDVRCLLHTHYH